MTALRSGRWTNVSPLTKKGCEPPLGGHGVPSHYSRNEIMIEIEPPFDTTHGVPIECLRQRGCYTMHVIFYCAPLSEPKPDSAETLD